MLDDCHSDILKPPRAYGQKTSQKSKGFSDAGAATYWADSRNTYRDDTTENNLHTLDFFIQRASIGQKASETLAQRLPSLSAKNVLSGSQILLILLVLLGGAAVFTHYPDTSRFAASIFMICMFGGHMLLKIVASIYSLYIRISRKNQPETQPGSEWKRLMAKRPGIARLVPELPVYSVMVPLYKEAAILPEIVAALKKIDYPPHLLDIKLLLEENDLETMLAARKICDDSFAEIIVVPCLGPHTKPKALNYGLTHVRGEFVCVYDAEDRPDPQQILSALDAFAKGGPQLSVVQAPLRIFNAGQSWLSRQFELEYLVQFDVILPFLSRLQLPMALGGTSNHFRVKALREINGWDAYNVTEDADIGFRLVWFGYHSMTIERPTLEEAPVHMGQWINQRSRWIKGHLQTWLVIMRDPFKLLSKYGLLRFIGVHLSFGVGLFSPFAYGVCILWIIFMLISDRHELSHFYTVFIILGYFSTVFACLTQLDKPPIGKHDLIGRVLSLIILPILYQSLQLLAGIKALLELVVSPHSWSKTPHGLSNS